MPLAGSIPVPATFSIWHNPVMVSEYSAKVSGEILSEFESQLCRRYNIIINEKRGLTDPLFCVIIYQLEQLRGLYGISIHKETSS
jgi:hypothetical protein